MNKSRVFVVAVTAALGMAAAAFALATAALESKQLIHCVNTTGANCGPVVSGGCFNSVQTAVDAANPSDVLRLAGGTYTSSSEHVLVLKEKPLWVEGGYDQACQEHDPDAYHTILDGQGNGSVISVTNTGGDVFMRWLYIRNGDGKDNCLEGYVGCGGGVYIYNSNFRLGHSVVEDNTGSTSFKGYGGGIYILNPIAVDPFVHIFDTRFISNTCTLADTAHQSGGGLHVAVGEVLLNDNLFQDNYCPSISDGGGASLDFVTRAVVERNTFIGNRSDRTSGGLLVSAQGGPITVSHNLFAGNQSDGSAAWLIGGYGIVEGNIFQDNHSAGLDIYYPSQTRVYNNLFSGNQGGLLALGRYDGIFTSHYSITNNTLVNSGYYGVYLEYDLTGELVNNIISGSDEAIYDGTFITRGLTIQSNNIIWPPPSGFTSTLDIFADPLLSAQYRPLPDSPAIDAGMTVPWLTTDLDGEPRPKGAAYDIGAYEGYTGYIYLPLVKREP